jgi:hypothetical protein
LRERGQKVSFETSRNFFVGELFNSGVDLPVIERLCGGEVLDELFEHASILRLNVCGSN